MMWQTWELFVIGCIVSSARSHTDSTLVPRNLSLSWIDDFYVNLSWVAPENVPKDCEHFKWSLCGTRIKVDDCDGFFPYNPSIMTHTFNQNRVIMEGGSLSFSVQTDCTTSPGTEPVFLNITYPDLVKNFQCSMTSCSATSCSWSLANHAPDLRFFYKKVREDLSGETPYLQECSDYLDTAEGRSTGCPLQGIDRNHNVYFLFNGTLNGSPVRNTFTGISVLPPPLNLTVTKGEGNHLNINWTVPNLATCIKDWEFKINYTVCNDIKIWNKPPQTSSVSVPFLPHCLYRIAISSSYNRGSTPWEEILYGEPRNPHVSMIAAAVVLPLVLAMCSVLSFACFRKYKDKICPNIPEPSDFLRDMRSTGNLYVPPQEDESDCKIDLVLEPLPDG